MAEKVNDVNFGLWDGADMNMENQGCVIQPQNYFMWRAELTGDTDDTGGFYVFLFAPNHTANSISFWDTSIQGVLRQLEEQRIVIEWESEISKC